MHKCETLLDVVFLHTLLSTFGRKMPVGESEKTVGKLLSVRYLLRLPLGHFPSSWQGPVSRGASASSRAFALGLLSLSQDKMPTPSFFRSSQARSPSVLMSCFVFCSLIVTCFLNVGVRKCGFSQRKCSSLLDCSSIGYYSSIYSHVHPINIY